jgi:hypothetical protein
MPFDDNWNYNLWEFCFITQIKSILLIWILVIASQNIALVRTDVSEELSATFIRVTRIGELGTTLMKEALSSCETSVLTRATRRNIPEDSILHSHGRENLHLHLNSCFNPLPLNCTSLSLNAVPNYSHTVTWCVNMSVYLIQYRAEFIRRGSYSVGVQLQ